MFFYKTYATTTSWYIILAKYTYIENTSIELKIIICIGLLKTELQLQNMNTATNYVVIYVCVCLKMYTCTCLNTQDDFLQANGWKLRPKTQGRRLRVKLTYNSLMCFQQSFKTNQRSHRPRKAILKFGCYSIKNMIASGTFWRPWLEDQRSRLQWWRLRISAL